MWRTACCFPARPLPIQTSMASTRNKPSSFDSPRPRKKHVHADCGEPVKGHHRVNGTLVCRPAVTDPGARAAPLKTGGLAELASQLQVHPFALEDLELAMEHSLQLLRDTKARGLGSRGMPGTLHETSSLPERRGASTDLCWTEVAVTALDTFRDLWKHTMTVVVLLLCFGFYLTRNDSPPKPSLTCVSA